MDLELPQDNSSLPLAGQESVVAASLQLLAEMNRVGAGQAAVEVNADPASAVLFKDKQPVHSITFERCPGRALETRLQLLATHWSDDSPDKTPRIVSAPAGGEPSAFSLSSRRKTGSLDRVFLVTRVLSEKPLLEGLELNELNRSAVYEAAGKKTGLVLVDSSQTPHTVDARTVLLALRPDALYVALPRTTAGLRELLAKGETHFVVVGQVGADPAQLIYQALGALSEHAEKERLLDLIRLAFVHRRARRTCPSCLKQTKIAPATLEHLPIVLRPTTETYMFGRGCERCGHSAYLGHIGLDSLVNVTDQLRALLKAGAPLESIIREAYRAGSRAMLEDGLEKVFKGQTSFEAVFAVAPTLPAGYGEAVELSKRRPVEAQTRFSALIVEDDIDQRGILEMVFKSAGYDVTGAESGVQALRLLETKPTDIVICDLMMPGMNGEDLVREMRRSPKLKNIPVLVLTAVSSPDAEYKLLEHGADDFCDKNVKRKVLLKRVENLLNRRPRNPVAHLAE